MCGSCWDFQDDSCCRREFCEAQVPGNPFEKYPKTSPKSVWGEFTRHDKLNFRVKKRSVKECVVVLIFSCFQFLFVCCLCGFAPWIFCSSPPPKKKTKSFQGKKMCYSLLSCKNCRRLRQLLDWMVSLKNKKTRVFACLKRTEKRQHMKLLVTCRNSMIWYIIYSDML